MAASIWDVPRFICSCVSTADFLEQTRIFFYHGEHFVLLGLRHALHLLCHHFFH